MNILEYLLTFFGINLEDQRDQKFRDELKNSNPPKKTNYISGIDPYHPVNTIPRPLEYISYGSASMPNFFITAQHPNGINYSNQGYNNTINNNTII